MGTRSRRVAAVAALSATLFGVGAIGAGRPTPPVRPPVGVDPAGPLEAGPVLGAGTAARLVSQLQQRLRAVPDDWRSYAALGLAYVQQARLTADPSYYSKAEVALLRSLELGPDDDPSAHVGLGVLALARHDFATALEHGELARALNPHDAAARGVIGDALLELGRYREAFAAYQDMVDLRPDLSSYARVAYARELQGDVAGAIAAMELALSSAGGAPEDAAWAGYQIGELHWGAGELSAAREAYLGALALAPDFVPARAGLARGAAARGHRAAAIRGYRIVVEWLPAPEHVIALADLYLATGREDLAARMDALVDVQERLAEANGVNTDLELALFHADRGTDLGSALSRARAEYARRPSVHAADALAWTLHAAGRPEAALPLAREALRLGYRNATFHYHAGVIALAAGRHALARRWLAEALAINPHFHVLHAPVAARLLAELGTDR
ncbi:MAG: tetratricopeptide repeat protein [Actinobacteria bacterium]|nr:tetratricopeptide repeat protein [Actinomycetota bacterium]